MHQEDQVVIGQISPPGYAFISVPRKYFNPKYQHGGIEILNKSQINLGQVTNLDLPNSETFKFTVVSNMPCSLYIVLIYRPSGVARAFPGGAHPEGQYEEENM